MSQLWRLCRTMYHTSILNSNLVFWLQIDLGDYVRFTFLVKVSTWYVSTCFILFTIESCSVHLNLWYLYLVLWKFTQLLQKSLDTASFSRVGITIEKYRQSLAIETLIMLKFSIHPGRGQFNILLCFVIIRTFLCFVNEHFIHITADVSHGQLCVWNCYTSLKKIPAAAAALMEDT